MSLSIDTKTREPSGGGEARLHASHHGPGLQPRPAHLRAGAHTRDAKTPGQGAKNLDAAALPGE